MSTEIQPLQLKYIVIGYSGVGKTSILRRLIDKRFLLGSPSTVGVEYFSYSVTIDNRPVTMMIWDTAGQERFYSIAQAYFRSAIGIVLVFDITSRQSFEDLPRWLRDARSEADPHCVAILVGNKSDLAETRVITREEAESFAAANNLDYIESSASQDVNIEEIFLKSGKAIVQKISLGDIDYSELVSHAAPTVTFTEEEEKPESKSCC